MNKKVGIYLRLSNEDRDKINKEVDSESIKNQRNMLIDYINKCDDLVLIDEYCDSDLSGAGTYRPEFERLIKDCENKKIDIVLCKSQSRFSRDMEVVEKYINNKFLEWGIRFIGISDNADTINVGNKKSRQINGLVNEWYLEDVSNNIRCAFNSKMKQGEFISPFAPYGYSVSSNNNNKLVVDIIASEIVKEIYNLYLMGLGFTGIAKYLNNKNISSPSFYKYQQGIKLNIVSNKSREEIKWNSTAIKTILTNEIYLGNLIQGKRTTVSYKNKKIVKKDKSEWIRINNTHESIIDIDTFNKVQYIMKKRTRSLKSTGLVHIFSGKVRCYECNHYMRKKNTKYHEYLVCSNIYNNCFNKSSIRYDELSNIVLDVINSVINKYYDISELEKLYLLSYKNKVRKKITFLEKKKSDTLNKLYKIQNYFKNLYEDKVNGIITVNQFSDLIRIYKEEENAYNSEIASIDKELDYLSVNKKDVLFKYQKFDKLNRLLVDEFIDNIYIGKLDKENGNRDIYIKFSF